MQKPFKTLQAATQAASQPGDTIHILPQREPATFFVDQNNPGASDENPGTAEAPFKTIQRAAESVLPGDTVKIRPGRYRETIVLHNPGQTLNVNDGTWETRRVTFEADGGEVILDGSMRIPDDAWQAVEVAHPLRITSSNKLFAAKVDMPPLMLRRGPAVHSIKLNDPKWVFVNDELLIPHSTPGKRNNAEMVTEKTLNRWFWDKEASTLYVNLDGKKPAAVDISVQYHAFGGWKPVHYTTLRGLTIQRYSHGAFYGNSEEMWIEDCLFRHNTLAIGGGIGGHVARCTFLDHEGTVVNAGQRTLYAQNIFVRYFQDNFLTRDIYNSCAIKSFGSDTYFTIRNNVMVDNGSLHKGYTGCGAIWFDNPSQGNMVYGNTIYHSGMGMYIEYPMINALITWNVVADTNEGIVLRHNIANSIVENYISRARSRGIKVSDTKRTMAPIVKYNFLSGNYIEDCGIGVAAGPEANSDRQQANISDGNIYNLQPGQLIGDWAGQFFDTIEDFRKGAGMDMHGRAAKLTHKDMDLASFRVADSDKPWKAYQMFGNARLDRIQFARSEYGDMQAKTFPGLPYFFEPGMGDGSMRKWFNGDHRAEWPRNKAVSIDKHPVGLSWYYSSCEPWTAVVTATTGGSWAGGTVRGYMKEEQGLKGFGGGDENGRLQVLSRGPEGAPAEGLGWFTVSLPTAPGAVIDIGLHMQALNVKPVEGSPKGGAVVMVEWSDYTRTKVARSYILGLDDQGKEHQGDLARGSFDYKRVEGSVTAPEWAKRFRLFMGMKTATGILQFDNIDTIRTRDAEPPPGHEEPVIPAAPVHLAKLAFEVLDLSKLTNRALKDEVADDLKGGWTDQGPQLDMRGISDGNKKYQGVPYRIEKPNNCIVLKSTDRPASDLPDKVSIPVRDLRFRRFAQEQGQNIEMICFLHALAGQAGQEHWRYVIHYADGSSETIPMVAGKNVRDWTDVVDWLVQPGQWRAFAAESTGGPIHPRQSLWVLEWKNPKPAIAIQSIEFVASSKGVPILLSVSLGRAKATQVGK